MNKCKICGKIVPIGKRKYCSEECNIAGYKILHRNAMWRYFYRKKGMKIPESIGYINKMEGGK